MAKKSQEKVRQEALLRVAKIRQVLAGIEFSCSGTLLERTKVCGKPGCRCAQDPKYRHGPYYEWTRRHNRALLHRVLTQEQAQIIREAIKNHRAILKLLHDWERETVRVIESMDRRNL
jgi:hypothetical protein